MREAFAPGTHRRCLAIMRGDELFRNRQCRVSGDMRGPAAVAQAHVCRKSEASRCAREAARAVRSAARAGYQAPHGKPDKRARKLIRALGDIDAL